MDLAGMHRSNSGRWCPSRVNPALPSPPPANVEMKSRGTFPETLAFNPMVLDQGESHEETSYRSRSGDYRDRGSCHAHHGGRALAGLGPSARRLGRRRAHRQRICTALYAYPYSYGPGPYYAYGAPAYYGYGPAYYSYSYPPYYGYGDRNYFGYYAGRY